MKENILNEEQKNQSCKADVVARCIILENALFKIIEMNRQNALDQYGEAEKAESWSCVVVARKALSK